MCLHARYGSGGDGLGIGEFGDGSTIVSFVPLSGSFVDDGGGGGDGDSGDDDPSRSNNNVRFPDVASFGGGGGGGSGGLGGSESVASLGRIGSGFGETGSECVGSALFLSPFRSLLFAVKANRTKKCHQSYLRTSGSMRV